MLQAIRFNISLNKNIKTPVFLWNRSDCGETICLCFCRTDRANHMFTLDLHVAKTEANKFQYKYSLTEQKDKYETLEDKTHTYTFRTWWRNIFKQDKGNTICLSADLYQSIPLI